MKTFAASTLCFLIVLLFANQLTASKELSFNNSCDFYEVNSAENLLVKPSLMDWPWTDYCTGSITVVMPDSLDCDLVYSIDSGASFHESNVFEGLCVNDYLIIVMNPADSTFVTMTTQISNMAQVEMESLDVSYSYCDACLGSIKINMAQESGWGEEYSIDGAQTWQSSNVFDNLCIADYIIIARSKADSTNFDVTTTHIGTRPDLEIVELGFTCESSGSSAMAEIEVQGGTSDYKLRFTNPIGQEFEIESEDGMLSFEVDDLMSGYYYFSLEDAKSCVKDTTIYIAESCAAINAVCVEGYIESLDLSNPECGGVCNGSIRAILANGTDCTYEYSIDGGASWQLSNAFDGLCEGDYLVSARNIEDFDDISILTAMLSCSQEPILINEIIKKDAYCDDCNGIIEIKLLQGDGSHVEYSIDAGMSWQNSNYFPNLCIGDYLIYARSKDNHDNQDVMTVQIGDAPDLKMVDFSFICHEFESSANAHLVVNGGTAAYTLTYLNPAGVQSIVEPDTSDIFNINFQIEEIMEGDYHFSVEDRLGCVKDTVVNVFDNCVSLPDGGNQIATGWFIFYKQPEPGELELSIDLLIPNEKVSLKLYNVMGQIVRQELFNQEQVWTEVMPLEPGTYFVVLESSTGQSEVFKLGIY